VEHYGDYDELVYARALCREVEENTFSCILIQIMYSTKDGKAVENPLPEFFEEVFGEVDYHPDYVPLRDYIPVIAAPSTDGYTPGELVDGMYRNTFGGLQLNIADTWTVWDEADMRSFANGSAAVREDYLDFSSDDIHHVLDFGATSEDGADVIVAYFYKPDTDFPEVTAEEATKLMAEEHDCEIILEYTIEEISDELAYCIDLYDKAADMYYSYYCFDCPGDYFCAIMIESPSEMSLDTAFYDLLDF